MSDQNDPQQQPDGPNPWVRQLMIWGGIFLRPVAGRHPFQQCRAEPWHCDPLFRLSAMQWSKVKCRTCSLATS